jgi:hypothetical protein
MRYTEEPVFKHIHASQNWVTINVSASGALEVVLVVETEIALDPSDVNFNDDNYNSLAASIAAYISSSEHFDRATIVPHQIASAARVVKRSNSHLAGWRFSIEEPEGEKSHVNVLDVYISDFHQAKDWALRQFNARSSILAFFPLSEENAEYNSIHNISEKWIPLRTPLAHESVEHFVFRS